MADRELFNPRLILLAQYEKKHFKLHTNYNPKLGKGCKVYYITPKFYSRYDTETKEIDMDFVNRVHMAYEQYPKEKYEFPQTDYQRLGWFNDQKIDCDRNDPRLHHPRVISEMMKTVVTILNSTLKK